MPRTWFRHEATMRHDPSVAQLAKEFGPIGELIWHRLLEVHCQIDGEIIATTESLRFNLALRPEWDVDLDAWLRRASQLRLIKLGKRRNDLRTISVRAWTKYQPAIDSPEYQREKKRRQRAQKSPGTRRGQRGDTKGTSPPTDGRTRRDPTRQDETKDKPRSSSSEAKVESVTTDTPPSSNGRVSHEPKPTAKRSGAGLAKVTTDELVAKANRLGAKG